MYRLCGVVAVAVLVVSAPLASALAKDKKASRPPQRPPVIINDPSLSRPPPPLQHERNYYGPAPTIQPPMERVPLPAPLAQPPVR
jgi:hypothetical protein